MSIPAMESGAVTKRRLPRKAAASELLSDAAGMRPDEGPDVLRWDVAPLPLLSDEGLDPTLKLLLGGRVRGDRLTEGRLILLEARDCRALLRQLPLGLPLEPREVGLRGLQVLQPAIELALLGRGFLAKEVCSRVACTMNLETGQRLRSRRMDSASRLSYSATSRKAPACTSMSVNDREESSVSNIEVAPSHTRPGCVPRGGQAGPGAAPASAPPPAGVDRAPGRATRPRPRGARARPARP